MAQQLYHGHERLLRQAIAQAPDDDLPRLIFADWLEEQGRTIEAEFIRVQLVSARLEKLSRAEQERHVTIYRRQNELLEQKQQLLRHVPKPLRQEGYFEFHRGLLSSIRAPLRLLLPFAAELQQLIPLPQIRLQDTVGVVRRTLGGPASPLEWLPRYYPRPSPTPAVDFTELATVLHAVLTTVIRHRQWYSRCVITDVDLMLGDLGEWIREGEAPGPLRAEIIPAFPRLKILDLSGAQLGDGNLRELFRAADRFPRLQYLDISANDVQDDTVAALLQTPWPRQLRRLILGGNPLTDRTARLLAEEWPDPTPLEDLNLRFTAIGHEGRRLLIHRFGGRVALF